MTYNSFIKTSVISFRWDVLLPAPGWPTATTAINSIFWGKPRNVRTFSAFFSISPSQTAPSPRACAASSIFWMHAPIAWWSLVSCYIACLSMNTAMHEWRNSGDTILNYFFPNFRFFELSIVSPEYPPHPAIRGQWSIATRVLSGIYLYGLPHPETRNSHVVTMWNLTVNPALSGFVTFCLCYLLCSCSHFCIRFIVQKDSSNPYHKIPGYGYASPLPVKRRWTLILYRHPIPLSQTWNIQVNQRIIN